jgi:hypothetical protein
VVTSPCDTESEQRPRRSRRPDRRTPCPGRRIRGISPDSERADFRHKDAVSGMIASIQTFGSYANFHPHVHAIVTDGVVAQADAQR